MITTSPSTFCSPSTDDLPFSVRDRRRKGFFTIDNELLDNFGAHLGAYGLAVYLALARFANQDSTCWPSLSTIAKRTGMSRPQVIREIAKLTVLQLIAVRHQVNDKGEYSSNLYLLLDVATPSPEQGVVAPRDHPGISQRLPLVSAGDQGGISQRPKQHLLNKTQHRNKTQRTPSTPLTNNNNSGGHTAQSPDVVVASSPALIQQTFDALLPNNTGKGPAREHSPLSVKEDPTPLDPPAPGQAGAGALIAVGIAPRVAQRLASRFSRERIEEKLACLDFLQDHQPDKVQNPRGWLRRAIEEDYAPPDGYLSAAEWERKKAEAAALAAAQAQAEQQRQRFAAQCAAKQGEWRRRLHEQYGTTEADERFWQEVCTECKHGQPHLYQLCTRAYVLTCSEDTVSLGFDAETWMHQLEHPGTLAVLKRALKGIAGRPLEVTTVLLSEEAMGYTGEDGKRTAAQE